MYLIFVFLDQISDKVRSAVLKFKIRFLRKCNFEIPEILQVLHGNVLFIFSEFDLERTTTKPTSIVYISLDLPFAAIEQTPHRIVLF